MMWKVLCVFLLVNQLNLIFCQYNLTERILERLERNLNYIDAKSEKINVDCLFGVILSEAILEDAKDYAGPYMERIESLQNLTLVIYNKTNAILQKDDYNSLFVDYVAVPGLWNKKIEFLPEKFVNVSPEIYIAQNILRNLEDTDGKIEHFVDSCFKDTVKQTLDMELKICHLRASCQWFLILLNSGYSYIPTHRLLLLQLANVRKCYMNPEAFTKAKDVLCGRIYTQVLSEGAILSFGRVFDLFLEQALLCGYEGFSDFLQPEWLELILTMQEESGCFKPSIDGGRHRRASNYFEDGCSDHTTGLGAGILSLYLNFYLKNFNPLEMIESTTENYMEFSEEPQ